MKEKRREIKQMKKAFKKNHKYLNKIFMGAMFTRWERIKLWFMGVRI